MDWEQFASRSFDVNAWVNSACKGCPEGEQPDKYLAEMEMKVQLAAEDIEQQLYDNSLVIVRRVSAAAADVHELRSSLLTIGESVELLAAQVATDERSSALAAARLRQLDSVKTRILDAKSTLQEASALKQQYDTLNEVLENNDTAAMLAALRTMRRSMGALAQVPEFSAVADKVVLLETRLKELSVPLLATALSTRNGADVRQHWQALAAIEKSDLAQEVYVRHVCVALQELYSNASAGGATSIGVWLPQWHASLLRFIGAERDWFALQLSEQPPGLLLQALSVALKSFVTPIRERLTAEHAAPAATLAMLTALLASTTACCRDIAALFPDTDPKITTSLTHPLFQPYESFIEDYARLETAVLTQEIKKILLPAPPAAGSAPTADAIEGIVNAIAVAPVAIQQCALAAVDRCTAFTAGLELAQLIAVLDASLEQSLRRVSAVVTATGRALAAAPASASAAAPAAPAELPTLSQPVLQQLLRLPLPVAALRRSVTLVDTEVRARATCVLEAARGLHADRQVPQGLPLERRLLDVIVWRLSDSTELTKVLSWQAMLAGVLLSKAMVALDDIDAAVDAWLTAALCSPARQSLAEVSRMAKVWEEDASVTSLTSFNPFPSTFATTTGEYLMTLPPLLEVLVPDDDASQEESSLAAQWLDRAATAVAEELRRHVMSIPTLGSKGSLQLAADLEYVCNSITALGAQLPPALATACTLSMCVLESDFKSMLAAGVADGSLDKQACKVLARMRGIST